MITPVTLIGFLAGTLTTISLFPQAMKCWKEKQTRDLSLGMYIVFTLGIVLWLVYGSLIGDWPMILANGVSLAVSSSILIMKIKYG